MADIGAGTRITIHEIEPPVEHFLMYAQLQRWLNAAVTNPAEAVRKKKLREMLASDGCLMSHSPAHHGLAAGVECQAFGCWGQCVLRLFDVQ